MRIQELETKTALDRATIRFYEREGLINPQRTENGYRDYSDDDAAHLLKIKLLRQLGMSVEKIREIQQGSVDFFKVMEEQIQLLSTRIDDQKRARAVCFTICRDGVNYASMDAAYYLQLMQKKSSEESTLIIRNFREDIPKEIHPFRRFAARIMDMHLFSVFVQLILYVVLRVRPLPDGIIGVALQFVILFLFLPVEALFLHLWGTTPGKWVMGIRVESAEGGKLTYFHALCRAWEVMKYGIGFNLPLWNWACAIKSYCVLTGRAWRVFTRYDEIDGPEDMEWDRDTEISYMKWERKGKLLLAGMLCVIVVLNAIVIMDSIRPKYRGEVDVAQFSSNYNSYASMLNRNQIIQEFKLQSDGTWQIDPNVTIYRDLTGIPEDVYAPFSFEMQDGYVRRITYQNKWNDVMFKAPLSDKCLYAAITAASAQRWFNIFTLYDFNKKWEYALNDPQGTLQYENIEIVWDMEIINGQLSDGYIIPSDEEGTISLGLYFEIIIHAN